MIWLIALTGLGSIAFVIGIAASGHVREWHHAYIGGPLAWLAIFDVVPLWAGYIGVVVLLDDAVQHLIQIERPDFRSPLHLAYRHLLFDPWQRLRR